MVVSVSVMNIPGQLEFSLRQHYQALTHIQPDLAESFKSDVIDKIQNSTASIYLDDHNNVLCATDGSFDKTSALGALQRLRGRPGFGNLLPMQAKSCHFDIFTT